MPGQESPLIGVLPVHELAPLEYQVALDAAATLVAGLGRLIIRCGDRALEGEVGQRFPTRAGGETGTAALWVEPVLRDWQQQLGEIDLALPPNATLVLVASRPLARLLPERRGWAGAPLGMQVGGLGSLRRALHAAGFWPGSEHGFHTLQAAVLNTLGRGCERAGWRRRADRLAALARLRYHTAGGWARLSTVALWVAQRSTG